MLRTLFIGFAGGLLLCGAIAVAPAQDPEPVTTPTTTTPPTSVLALTEPTPAATALETSPAPATATPVIEPAPIGPGQTTTQAPATPAGREQVIDYTSLLYVFMLATFIGLGVILRVSRLLHTPLMSLTNAISAIAVVGSIVVTGNPDPHLPTGIRILGAIALFASMTNIVSGFLITDRMLKMFKSPRQGGPR